MRLPDFIIGGAARAGTTWLCHMLARHPEIGFAQPFAPEPKFFLVDDLYSRGLGDYAARCFDGLTQPCVGEKSTNYLESPIAAARIAADLPCVRLIFVLRDPVERAYSNFRWSRANGHETLDFDSALDTEPTRRVPSELRYARPYAYAERGMYARLLWPYLASAPGRVLLLRLEDIVREAREMAARTHAFLHLAERPHDADGLGAVNDCQGGPIPPGPRRRLAMLYREPDTELAAMTGLDVSDWTSQREIA